MRTFSIDPLDVARPDSLVDLFPFTTWTPFCKYFLGQNEHYRLLSHLSWQLERGETVVDVGTFLGFSALALSHNQRARVITYDLTQSIPATSETFTPLHRHTIDFRLGNVLGDLPLLLDAPLMFLDTNHDGTFEREFVAELTRLQYRGIVICDDIDLNDEMRAFWKDVAHTKMDLTPYGHWSGTGAILFDPLTTNLHIQNGPTGARPPRPEGGPIEDGTPTSAMATKSASKDASNTSRAT